MTNHDKDPAWSASEYWQKRFDQADTPWELGVPSTVVLEALDRLEALGCHLDKARVLVAGCGSGSDAVECARRGAHVVAVDWSDTAVVRTRTAYETVRGAVSGTLTAIQGDFFALTPQSVDVVCEHTFFCAIDPSARARYVETVALWLKPGGYLCGNFFVLPDEEVASFPGLSLTKEGVGPPFVTTERALRSAFATHFEVVQLQAAAKAEPSRRPGIEWIGVLRRV